jgi:hypothetical protein
MAEPPQEHGGQPLDSTAEMPATDGQGADLPPAGMPAPEAAPATEAAVPAGPASAPTTPAAPGGDHPPQKWAARASVPTSRDAEESAEWELGGPPGRGVLVPVLLAILILVLLTLGAFGIWLGLRGPSEPGPTPTTPVGPTTASTTPSRPTTPPVTTPPAQVTLEDYRGRPADDVIAALTGLGLAPQRVDEANAEVPAGRVIRTEPGAGAKVPVGGAVKVFVSTGPPEETTPPPTTPGPTP